jgi:hypothetical protein
LHASDAAMVEQDIKDASSARDDYALQQSVIASLSQHALLGGSLPQLFDDAARRACETLGVSHSTVLELQSDHETLIGKAGSGWEADVVRTIVAEAGARSHAGYALLVNAPVIVTDFSRERRLRSSIAERWGLQSGVAVVIHGREHPFGVLAIHDTQLRQFGHDEVNFLQSVANILDLAIEQNRTESELRASERYFRSLIGRHQRSHNGLRPGAQVPVCQRFGGKDSRLQGRGIGRRERSRFVPYGRARSGWRGSAAHHREGRGGTDVTRPSASQGWVVAGDRVERPLRAQHQGRALPGSEWARRNGARADAE